MKPLKIPKLKRLLKLVSKSMGNGSHERPETGDELPADKRSCSSLESRPSTSSSSPRTPSSSSTPPLTHSAAGSSSSSSPSDLENSSASTSERKPESSSSAPQTPHQTSTSTSEIPKSVDMETSSSSPVASTRSDGDSHYESDDLSENDPRYNTLRMAQERRSQEDQGKYNTVISRLTNEADCSEQLVALTELCELLSFSTEGSISNGLSDQLAPPLVKLARQEAYPDVVLLALRSITYLCDVCPRASAFLVRSDAVPTLCQRLAVIEYLDVAEQCLQALERISRDQPLACLESGAIMSVLGYIDFFSTSVQRAAVSTVVNICKKLPSECPATLLEAVPRLCDLLQYEDRQLVEKVATCLMKIVDRVKRTPNMLTTLCSQGVVSHVTHLINRSSRTNMSKSVLMGLIGLLATFACASADAVRILFELNVGRICGEILSSNDLSIQATEKNSNLVHEALKLLIAVLPPPVSEDHVDQLISSKKRILVDNPRFLQKFGIHVVPVLIEMVNSGTNMIICYGCLCIIKRVIKLSEPDSLYEMIKDSNISSFLIGALSKKDHHVLALTLQIIEDLLEKLSDILMCCFAKEGVLFAINSLIVPEKCSQLSYPLISWSQTSSDPNLKTSEADALKCLCYTYSDQSTPTSEPRVCMLEKDSIHMIAQRISTAYFTSEQHSSDCSMSDVLRNLKKVSSELVNLVNTSRSYDLCIQHEEKFSNMLHQVMEHLTSEESISLFELMESGITKAMLAYLLDNGAVSDASSFHRRLGIFARISHSSNSISAELPLLLLVRKLQGALSMLESFPVVISNFTKLKGSYAMIPNKQSTTYPCLKVRFKKSEEETELSDYSDSLVAVDPFSPVEAIEQYLRPKVKRKIAKQTKSEAQDQESMKEEKDNMPDGALMDIDSNEKSPDKMTSPNGANDAKTHLSADANGISKMDIEKSESDASSDTKDGLHKLAFYLEDEELDYSATLYQEILRRRVRSHNNVCDCAKYWRDSYCLTFKRSSQTGISEAEHSCMIAPDNLMPPQQYMPSFSCLFVGKLVSDLDSLSPTNDILLLLKSLEMINKFSYQLMSHERVTAFVEGKISNLDDMKVSAHTVSRIEFVNNKLTEKLEQQIRDTLSVCIGALPLWCSQLMSNCPFLFSFETRCKYFQLASFGRPQNQSQPPSQGEAEVPRDRRVSGARLSKKKFLVDRHNVLDSAALMMESIDTHKVAVEVEYMDEVGTGLGPTLEFFTLVSRAFQSCGLGMWRESSTGFGLFPRPWSLTSDGAKFADVTKKFALLGQLVAKALQDGRVLDIPFSRTFYSLVLGKELGLYEFQSVDPALGKSLLEFQAIAERRNRLNSSEGDNGFRSKKIEDLCLDFTLPGYPDYILAQGVDKELVSIDNLEEYVRLVVDATLRTGISRQVEAFNSGFNQVFPISHLSIFTEEELERLLCGEQDSWKPNELVDNIKFDHGYTTSSPPIINLLDIMQEFDHGQQRAFVQFVTGAPHLPPGGLAALDPKLTVVRKQFSNTVDLDLPSVMTCANYLKLPPYPSKEIMRQKILYAISEGQGSFHLS